jgi:hypothetical protein
MIEFKFPRPIVALVRWIDDAKWYHIWNPGSGFLGGCICGAILCLFLLVAIV